jgi:hypothetical protein
MVEVIICKYFRTFDVSMYVSDNVIYNNLYCSVVTTGVCIWIINLINMLTYFIHWWLSSYISKGLQRNIKQSNLYLRGHLLYKENVIFKTSDLLKGFNSYEILHDRTSKRWPSSTDDRMGRFDGTFRNSPKIVEANSIPLSHKYMTVCFPVLVHALR